jgi:hypothetical protein
MSVKRYSSPCVKFTVNVKLAGKQIQVVFDRYNQETKRRYVDISNGEIQQLMEQCPDYNVYFRCEFSIEDPANVPPDVMIPEQLKAEEIKDPEKVKTFLTNADAKLWINEFQSTHPRGVRLFTTCVSCR